MTDFMLGLGRTAMGAGSWLSFFANIWQLTQDEPRLVEGRQLDQFRLLSGGEGRVIPQVFGRARIGGHLIFADAPKEHHHDEEQGIKGGPSTIRRQYSYTVSFAIALCQGPISQVGRVWADGQIFDLAQSHFRVHLGSESQPPDPLIQEVEGEMEVPAFRGIAYVVFIDFNITAFGNRIPQFNFEVFAQPEDGLAPHIHAVNIIPACTEFGYDPVPHIRLLGRGRATNENTHNSANQSDWSASLDQLEQTCPNVKWVSLVVSWFGTDLRLGHCRLEPRHEGYERYTRPDLWSVAGLSRDAATQVSFRDGRPIFGGTPNDASVVRAIQDLRARGYQILFYPFFVMDVARGLPDPWGRAEQPESPWRGEITYRPDPAQPALTLDAAMARFVYGIDDSTGHTGTKDKIGSFGLAHMITHYAKLCASAGGVDAFLVGSEFKKISILQDDSGLFPFADHLIDLARAVRTHLPVCQISYAADWSEYGAHYLNPGAVAFPLDAFWASDACDFVGIDAYFPLSDWRAGTAHHDYQNGAASIYSPTYLTSQVRGGEYFDYYYRSEDDRQQQRRTPFDAVDPVMRQLRAKDVLGFWKNRHLARDAAGVVRETGWVPESKPIWFTEIGCPAMDKGSNQPNRFPAWQQGDPGLPHFSNGRRDDRIQRLYLTQFMSYYRSSDSNPLSTLDQRPMVPPFAFFIWAWDARPYPAFPMAAQIWSDVINWSTGHWINARLSSLSFHELTSRLLGQVLLRDHEDHASQAVIGYVVDRWTSPRTILEPIFTALGVDIIWTSAGVELRHTKHKQLRDLTRDDLLAGDDSVRFTQADRARLPRRLALSYFSAERDYDVAVCNARYPDADRPLMRVSLPAVLKEEDAERFAYHLLHAVWLKSQTARFRVSYAQVDLEPGDLIRFDGQSWCIRTIRYGSYLELDTVRYLELDGQNPTLTRMAQNPASIVPPQDHNGVFQPAPVFYPDIELLNLPDGWPAKPHGVSWGKNAILVAASANPFPPDLRVEDEAGSWSVLIPRAAGWGETQNTLPAMRRGHWTWPNSGPKEGELEGSEKQAGGDGWRIILHTGQLSSRSVKDVLNGANCLAARTRRGWEVIQFQRAELVGDHEYVLTGLLRGQAGSDGVMDPVLAAGSRVILLDGRLTPLPIARDDLVPRLLFGPEHMDRHSYAWRTWTPPSPLSSTLSDGVVHAPAHLQARFDGGDLMVSWLRRAPIVGDDFQNIDIALDPECVGFVVEVWAGDQRLIQDQTEVPHWRYLQATLANHYDEDADVRWSVCVSQLHLRYGSGHRAELDLTAALRRHQQRFASSPGPLLPK